MAASIWKCLFRRKSRADLSFEISGYRFCLTAVPFYFWMLMLFWILGKSGIIKEIYFLSEVDKKS
jgi:hypothetical protein